LVAVGTTIADRPPHRAVRAALPHTAPTLEDWREVLLLAHRSIHGTLHPRTVSGWCWLEQCSPWPAPFSPQAPPKIALLCSSGSSIVWRGPTPPKRARVLRLRRTDCSLAFIAKQPCCLPPIRRESASWFCVFRSSIARPTDTPVYASSGISRCHLQD
jgi:hypothetical protein